METINIDGRFLILFVAVILALVALMNFAASVWLENQDHRRARGWDNDKCNKNFLDWLALKVAANPFFKRVMIGFLIPVVVLYVFIRYPHLMFKRAYENFEKQVNSALDFLRR